MKASTAPSPNSARTWAGVRRSCRNGPCSGSRNWITWPLSRTSPVAAGLAGPVVPGRNGGAASVSRAWRPRRPSGAGSDGRAGDRSLMSRTASGTPSGSFSASRRWDGGTTSSGTSSVTGTGHAVPSASVPDSLTDDTSAAVMNPVNGAKAPESSISRSASWFSSRVQEGRLAKPAASPAAASAVTSTSVRRAALPRGLAARAAFSARPCLRVLRRWPAGQEIVRPHRG